MENSRNEFKLLRTIHITVIHMDHAVRIEIKSAVEHDHHIVLMQAEMDSVRSIFCCSVLTELTRLQVHPHLTHELYLRLLYNSSIWAATWSQLKCAAACLCPASPMDRARSRGGLFDVPSCDEMDPGRFGEPAAARNQFFS